MLRPLVVAATFFAAGAVWADELSVPNPTDVLSSGDDAAPALAPDPSIAWGRLLAGHGPYLSEASSNYLPFSSDPQATEILAGTDSSDETTLQWGWPNGAAAELCDGAGSALLWLPPAIGDLASDLVDIAARDSATCTLQTACILAPGNQEHEAADAADREVNWALLTDTTWSADDTWHDATADVLACASAGPHWQANFQGTFSALQAQGALGTAF
jgi:hypothetical protein